MLQKRFHILLMVLSILVLSGCHTTKFVPEGQYLLNKAQVKVEDTKQVQASELSNYMRQKQNSEIFGFWKLQLDIYNTASLDTSKWTSKNARKMGEAPVIFSPELTDLSCRNLTAAMQNKGYFHAVVDTTIETKEQLLNLTYHVTANEPYFIHQYTQRLAQTDLMQYASNSRTMLLHEGMQFDADLMNEERGRISSAMQRAGYFYFENDFLHYEVDSTIGNKRVNVTLCLQDYIENLPQEKKQQIFRRYRIRHVYFHMDCDSAHIPEGKQLQTSEHEGYSFSWIDKQLLREQMLIRNCPIRPGDMYNSQRVERAYGKLNQLSPIKYVDINFRDVGNSELDCHILLSRGKLNSVSAEIEGTYSAGDWGIGLGAGYTNRNLFHGAEEFSLNAKSTYEWRQTGSNAFEAKATAGLKFPNSLEVKLGYSYQNRPSEFTRTISNIGLNYTLPRTQELQHNLRILDISYVYLPWIDDAFREQFLQPTNIMRYSYEDHLIMGFGYSGAFTTARKNQPLRSYVNITYNAETAGNLLQGIYTIFRLPSDDEGHYQLLNVTFAQYAKVDASVSFHQILADKHKLVWHAGLGIAVPYGNSSVLPFEKRYFSGGSNSVRGWMARALGPGGFRSSGGQIDYNSQTGDIKLDLNLEYRWHVWSMLELAAFMDAGNIWTIADYESQPHGVFRFNDFYQQIAMSWGLGVRLDFSVFVFRVDVGVKLYDPCRLYYDGAGTAWRTATTGLNWNDDVTWHFAIGYPF